MDERSSRAGGYVPFSPRVIAGGLPLDVGAFRLKPYQVSCPPAQFEPRRFAGDLAVLRAALPDRRPPAPGLPGVGFVIRHQGPTADYLVLAWWDRENELPIRVWLHDGGAWRTARDGESVCVWDLEIVWYERNAWIETGLSGRPLAITVPEYLSRRFQPR